MNEIEDLKKRIIELEKKVKVLQKESETDFLTDLKNRRARNKTLENLKGESFFYAFFDLDDFKKINDKFGHKIGDNFLIEVSSIFLKFTDGEENFSFRLGGDEFVFISKENEKKNFIEKIEKIIFLIGKINHEGFFIGASVGVIECKKGQGFERMKKNVDDAMYESKKTGKNKITFFSEM